eukprot:CAMPEP_0184327238 /NCGR_PEP_ID=MMETSP1049-20130417/142988_1 /TAXON_ID=77928 /ORGANISM="Proteomonas sulcata, Strain CCMP704" /LENGTH=295 /DNA_ID=CAMNT_0026649485 /DNA_START=481 /DNA_END=1368 /DNA_ORIENTATION=-
MRSAIQQAYKLSAEQEFVIQWVDEDGDTITVSSDDEWAEALSAAASGELALIVQAGASVTAEHIRQLESDAEWVFVDEQGNSLPQSVVNSASTSFTHSSEANTNVEAAPPTTAAPAPEPPVAQPEVLSSRLEAEELEKRLKQEEMDRQAAEELVKQLAEEERRAEQEALAAREREQALERERAQAEANRLEKEAKEAEERRMEDERLAVEARARLEAERAAEMAAAQAAQAEAAAAKPLPAGDSTLQLDANTWGLLYQLEEMGFGNDFKKLHNVMKAHNMDLGAAAEALAAEAMV